MKRFRLRLSEICLLVTLILMIGLIRVYYGGDQGLMVVWKGEFSYKDTLVSVAEFQKMPKQQLLSQHRSVYWQLVSMDVLEVPEDLTLLKKRKTRPLRTPEQKTPAPDEQSPPGNQSSGPEIKRQ